MQRIAIVDPSDASRDSLRSLLLGIDTVWLEAECARYEYFHDVIQQSVPDLVIISLDADENKALNLVSQLAAEYPRLPIITISRNAQALLQSLQRGAKSFLSHPIDFDNLYQSIRKAIPGNDSGLVQPGRPSGPNAMVISILGSRGGVGCTTIACNLAAAIAADPVHQVALVDLDLSMGDADIVLETTGGDNISIADLARNIERLDMNFIRRAMVKHESGVSILRHPLEMSEVGSVHDAHIERIINLLRISYTYLIIDLSKAFLPTDIMAMRMSDVILLVGQLELSSLRNVVRMLHTLGNEENLGEKIRLVMNRVGSDVSEDGISLKKAEEVVGRPIFWQIPNDAKAVIGSRVAGVPLLKHSPRSRVNQSLQGLADTLIGKTPATTTTTSSRKSGVKWFFGSKETE